MRLSFAPVVERPGLCVLHVLEDLRPAQRREIAAQAHGGVYDPFRIVAAIDAARHHGVGETWVVRDAGAPRGLVCLIEISPGVAAASIFATREWSPKMPPGVWRWLKRFFVPERCARYRRVEVETLADGDVRWLQRLGFTVDGQRLEAGSGGESFLRLSWLRSRSQGAPRV